jgi:hypothetical protein
VVCRGCHSRRPRFRRCQMSGWTCCRRLARKVADENAHPRRRSSQEKMTAFSRGNAGLVMSWRRMRRGSRQKRRRMRTCWHLGRSRFYQSAPNDFRLRARTTQLPTPQRPPRRFHLNRLLAVRCHLRSCPSPPSVPELHNAKAASKKQRLVETYQLRGFVRRAADF